MILLLYILYTLKTQQHSAIIITLYKFVYLKKQEKREHVYIYCFCCIDLLISHFWFFIFFPVDLCYHLVISFIQYSFAIPYFLCVVFGKYITFLCYRSKSTIIIFFKLLSKLVKRRKERNKYLYHHF